MARIDVHAHAVNAGLDVGGQLHNAVKQLGGIQHVRDVDRCQLSIGGMFNATSKHGVVQ